MLSFLKGLKRSTSQRRSDKAASSRSTPLSSDEDSLESLRATSRPSHSRRRERHTSGQPSQRVTSTAMDDGQRTAGREEDTRLEHGRDDYRTGNARSKEEVRHAEHNKKRQKGQKDAAPRTDRASRPRHPSRTSQRADQRVVALPPPASAVAPLTASATVRVQRGGSLAHRPSRQPSPRDNDGSPSSSPLLEDEVRNAFSPHRQEREGSPSESAARGRGGRVPASQRPLYLTNDEMFMQYLRQGGSSASAAVSLKGGRDASTSPRVSQESPSAPRWQGEETRHRDVHERDMRSGSYGNRNRGGVRTRSSRRLNGASPAPPRPSPPLLRDPHSPRDGKKAGAVVYSDSSSSRSSSSNRSSESDETAVGADTADSRAEERVGPQQRTTVTAAAATTTPRLVDASKVFKISPDREEKSEKRRSPSRHLSSRAEKQQKRPATTPRVTTHPAEKRSPTQEEYTNTQRRREHSPPSPRNSPAKAKVNNEESVVHPVEKDGGDSDRHARSSTLRVHTPPPPRSLMSLSPSLEHGGANQQRHAALRPEDEESVNSNAEPSGMRSAAAAAAAAGPSTPHHGTTALALRSPSTIREDEEGLLHTDTSAANGAFTALQRHHRRSRRRSGGDGDYSSHHELPPASSPAAGTRRLHTAWSTYLAEQHVLSPLPQGRRDGATASAWILSQDHTPSKPTDDGAAGSGQLAVQPQSDRHALQIAQQQEQQPSPPPPPRNLEKEVLLLRASLLMTYVLLASRSGKGSSSGGASALYSSAAARRWQRQMSLQAGWPAAAVAHDGAAKESVPESHQGTTTAWPQLEASLAACVHGAVQDLVGPATTHHSGSATHPLPGPQDAGSDGGPRGAAGLLPPPRLLLRETPAHDLMGLPSLWYPPHITDAIAPVSGVLSVWFSGSEEGKNEEDDDVEVNQVETTKAEAEAGASSASLVDKGEGSVVSETQQQQQQRRDRRHHSTWSRLSGASRQSSLHSDGASKSSRAASASAPRGSWRRCFVVADDRGVCVYPTERDYAELASERLLLAIPYTHFAYLIPDFAEAAAVVHGDASAQHSSATTSPSLLPAVQAGTIATVGAALTSGREGEDGSVCFGFVRRQPADVERQLAVADATRAGLFHLPGSHRHGLRFAPWRSQKPFSSAASSSSASCRPHPPLVMRTSSRLAHAEWVHYLAYKFNRHLYSVLFPTTCAAMAAVGLRSAATQTEPMDGPVAAVNPPPEQQQQQQRSLGVDAGNTNALVSGENQKKSDERPPPSASSPAATQRGEASQQHDAQPELSGGGRASWVKAIADLRRTVESRDVQLHEMAEEHAVLTKSLRQRERQVRDLQQGHQDLYTALEEALTELEKERQAERREAAELRRAADAALAAQQQQQQQLHEERRRGGREDDTDAAAAGHRAGLRHLQERLDDVQRRYAADRATWASTQQRLEARCRLSEVRAARAEESAADRVRSLAQQAVRDLDSLHSEARQGTADCVSSMLTSRGRPGTSPPAQQDSAVPQAHVAVAATQESSHGQAATARPIASLLLLTSRTDSGGLVDGELTVDEAEARLLYSGPTTNQRGRRWELRHHETDALLRIQLELLSRSPADPHRSSTHAPPQRIEQRRHDRHGSAGRGVAAAAAAAEGVRRRSPSSAPRAPPPPLSPPPHALASDRLLHYSDASVHGAAAGERRPNHRSATDSSGEESEGEEGGGGGWQRRHRSGSPEFLSPLLLGRDQRSRRVGSVPRRHTPLSSVLRAVNVSPRDTRASRLRQAAIERQIYERAAMEGA